MAHGEEGGRAFKRLLRELDGKPMPQLARHPANRPRPVNRVRPVALQLDATTWRVTSSRVAGQSYLVQVYEGRAVCDCYAGNVGTLCQHAKLVLAQTEEPRG